MERVTLAQATGLCIVAGILLTWLNVLRRRLHPGPFPLPLLGNALPIARAFTQLHRGAAFSRTPQLLNVLSFREVG